MIKNISNFDLIFSAFPVPCLLIDDSAAGFTVTHCNAAFAKTIAHRTDPTGMRVDDLFGMNSNPDASGLLLQSMQQAIVTGEPHEISGMTFCLNGDTATHWKINNIPVSLAGRTCILQTLQRAAEEDIKANLSLTDCTHANSELQCYKKALDATSLILAIDDEGVISYANDKFLEYYEFTREEIIGQTQALINSGFHDKQYRERIWDAARAGKVWHGEIRNVSKHGKHYWMDTTVVPCPGEKSSRYLVIRKDITQRKDAEENLQASDEKYRMLFEHAPFPLWIYDEKTLQFREVNTTACSNYGYTREEFLQMSLHDIRPAEDIARLEEAIEATRQNKHNAYALPFRHKKKNGEVILVKIETTRMLYNACWSRLVSAVDITAERDTQEQLRAANDRLRAASEIAHMGYWSNNLQTGQIEWSKELYEIFEKDPAAGKLTLDYIRNCYHPEDRKLFSADFGDTGIKQSEHRIVTASGGKKWIFERLRSVKNDDDKVVQIEGIVVDITRRKQDEQALLKKTRLLQAFNSFTTLLLRKDNWSEALQKSLEIIGESISTDRIFYFENETDEATGEKFVSMKLWWARDASDYRVLFPHLRKAPFGMNKVATDKMSKGEIFESLTKDIADPAMKHLFEKAGVKTLLMLPVLVADTFYGFVSFHDCSDERIWDEEEKSFFKSFVSNLATVIGKQKLEEDAQKTNEQLKSVISGLPGIAIRRKAGGEWPVIFINDEVERITGYSAAEFINGNLRTWESIIHPEDRFQVMNSVRQVKSGNIFVVAFRVKCKNGDTVWLRGRGRNVPNADGSAGYVDGVMIDITELVKKEEQIRESNNRFRLVLKATREAIADWDLENNKVIWGDGFYELFGYETEGERRLWIENIHPDDQQRVTEELRAALKDASQTMFHSDFRFLKADRQTAYVKLRGIFIRNEKGRVTRAVGSMADITELMERTGKIEKQNAMLRQIAWTQSHVVRAPVANLLGLMELLVSKDDMRPDKDELIRNIVISTNQLDAVIHDIVSKTEELYFAESMGDGFIEPAENNSLPCCTGS